MCLAPRINRIGAILAVALAANAVASLGFPVAGQASVPDAFCAGPPDVSMETGNHTERYAQTFSPINGGYLTAIRFFIYEVGHGSNYLIQITPVNSTNLAPVNPGVVIAEATIVDSSIAISPDYHGTETEAVFTNPPAVSASSEYAIVVKRPGDELRVGIRSAAYGSGEDPCPDGGLYRSPDDSTAWDGPLEGDDMVFSTYVDGAPATPTPPPASPQPIAPLVPLAAPLTPSATCKVPKLVGKTLERAKKKIRSGGCKLGKVTKEEGATAKTGTVAKQTPKPGKILAVGTKVSVTLS